MTSSKSNRIFLYIAASIANISTFIVGTAIGWTSPEIPLLQNITTSPLDRVITVSEEGWLGSFLPLAATVGPIAGGLLANKIGRKATLLVSALPFIVANALFSFASSMTMFFAGRVLSGLASGIIFTAVPMYIGEISDDKVRGALGSFLQLFSVSGLVFSYSIGPFVPIKVFNIILIIPPIIFMIVFSLFIPESPFYLIQIGKNDKALEALLKLRGNDKIIAQKDMLDIKKQIEEDSKNRRGIIEMFSPKGVRKGLILAFALIAFQQLSGVNAVFYYTQNIFIDAGVDLPSELCVILIGIFQFVISFSSTILIEKSGKRFLLLFSALGISISLGVLAYYFYLKDNINSDVSGISWLPIVSIVSFTISYCAGLGPIPFAVVGELFPANVKPIAAAASTSFCWTLSFMTVNYFGIINQSIGKVGSFGLFSGLSFIGTICIYKFVPETTGMSLIEIQAMLNGETKQCKNTEAEQKILSEFQKI